MRKVTASAVILTALTGCGQNSGIPSTQWSFEIPSENENSSLALSRDSGDMADGTFVSTSDQPLIGQSAVEGLGAASRGDMMGPAFKQPSLDIETTTVGLPAAGVSRRSGLGSSSPSLAGVEKYSSASSSNLTSGYQSVAARPDPVAQVNAFLSASGSPNDLSNREPYRSDILAPSLPTVYLPGAASITSTLGNPTEIASQTAYADNASFANAGLPVLESSGGGIYSSSGSSSPDLSTVALAQGQPVYQSIDYPTVYPAVTVPATEGLSSPGSSSELAPSATLDDGLPVLEASRAQDVPIGTAILQDLQRTETAQVVQSLPAEKNSNGSIDISIMPAEMSVADDESVISSEAVSDQSIDVSTSAPTLESLRRSMVVQEESPLVAYASQAAEADLAVDPNLVVGAIAVSNPNADFPTLESLLETMPETAARPNFSVNLPDNNAASPLLEGFESAQPLSTLYLPIPEATSESSADTTLPTHVSLMRNSLASLAASPEMLSQRNKVVLGLVDKLSTKRRQLVTY